VAGVGNGLVSTAPTFDPTCESVAVKFRCATRPVAESFFHSIKTLMIHHCKFQNVAEAEQALFNYIEVYYNRQRKHSTNSYKSPAHFELEWWNNKKAA
jgi:transposase InsO family protein